MKTSEWLLVPALFAGATVAAPAIAMQYLSVEQAQKALFPGATRFVPADITLTPALKQQVEQASKVRVRNEVQPAWRAQANGQTLGWFFLDEVIGKHEFITYAVALSPQGEVLGIDILEYRETHGSQIKDARWRQQFVGKKAGDPFKLDQDIPNISGATLSCRNVANGVKRLLATYQAALR
jgi:Na+-translocating ferredoxin:NAD+ oxidoreductase RnfG subunit